jgi:adenylate cyclase
LISYETYAHINDEIHCEKHGRIDVKGIAYPVSTYRVVDLLERLETRQQSVQTELPHLKLNLEAGLMSADERREAAEVSQHALERLSNSTTGES